MPDLYPLFFKPVLKQYTWGGRNMVKLGRDLPEGQRVAESWEIAAHADGESVVRNGPFAGKTLPKLITILGADLVGRNNQWALDRGIFPLMVKLLDAEERLSVQVHPSDDYARLHEGQGELGKAEMWVILSAEPGAQIIYGFSEETTPDAFRQAIKSGRIESYLNYYPVQAGDHICVPPGTLHAILGGIMVAEIQQNSNTTYRVYDWNRTDMEGKSRALHVDQALDVINFQQVRTEFPPPDMLQNSPQLSWERLCQNKYFSIERINCHQDTEIKGHCDGTTLEIWGVICGRAKIAGEWTEQVNFCLLPAGLGNFSIQAQANSTLLRAYTP
ncbi:MAG: type I phosphomannose isomerase catalytic subunit [Brevefilum sp.]